MCEQFSTRELRNTAFRRFIVLRAHCVSTHTHPHSITYKHTPRQHFASHVFKFLTVEPICIYLHDELSYKNRRLQHLINNTCCPSCTKESFVNIWFVSSVSRYVMHLVITEPSVHSTVEKILTPSLQLLHARLLRCCTHNGQNDQTPYVIVRTRLTLD